VSERFAVDRDHDVEPADVERVAAVVGDRQRATLDGERQRRSRLSAVGCVDREHDPRGGGRHPDGDREE
jgi:hypothetical protein